MSVLLCGGDCLGPDSGGSLDRPYRKGWIHDTAPSHGRRRCLPGPWRPRQPGAGPAGGTAVPDRGAGRGRDPERQTRPPDLPRARARDLPDYEGSNDYKTTPLWSLRVGNLYDPETYVS